MRVALLPRVLVILIITGGASAGQTQAKRPFTLADDIAFAHFVASTDPYSGGFRIDQPVQFSPKGEFFVVLNARGRLDLNQVEESLCFYRTRDIEAYLKSSIETQPPSPVWVVDRLGKKDTITNFRWLADSRGLALQERAETGNDRVYLLNLRDKSTELLTDRVGRDGNFDIGDRNHYIYDGLDPGVREEFIEKQDAARRAPSSVYTSGNVWDLYLPLDFPGRVDVLLFGKRKIWAVAGGKPFHVMHDGAPLRFANAELISAPAGSVKPFPIRRGMMTKSAASFQSPASRLPRRQ